MVERSSSSGEGKDTVESMAEVGDTHWVGSTSSRASFQQASKIDKSIVDNIKDDILFRDRPSTSSSSSLDAVSKGFAYNISHFKKPSLQWRLLVMVHYIAAVK